MIINPRRVTATPPTERIDGSAVLAENIGIELGYRIDATWTVAALRFASDAGTPIVFDLAALEDAPPADAPMMLGVRAVESRPDLVTDDFPNGVDLYSTWAEGGEVIFANPPQAPAAVTIEGAG